MASGLIRVKEKFAPGYEDKISYLSYISRLSIYTD